MYSNLPPGLSESQIPGCTPDDHAIDTAIAKRLCEACKYYPEGFESRGCINCFHSDCEVGFEAEEDEALILERLKDKAESRGDGHKDE